ncbi:PaaI family thioesterase [Sphingomicrobium flavum]|uniref:PaaI family thioesterase n=1 Tax=Sphingomicrobium flavum TaxID=1229164 RepID=UPI0021ADE219|nr:PaaI family thioesterase [Sphingomicrobium flavum]
MSTLPPYAQVLRLSPERVGGKLRFTMPFGDDVAGRPGFLHGGAIAGLMEFTAFAALADEIGDDRVAMKPVTITVDYMRAGIHEDTYAEAVIERLGRRIANVEVFAWQKDRDTPIASARLNFMLDRPQRHTA